MRRHPKLGILALLLAAVWSSATAGEPETCRLIYDDSQGALPACRHLAAQGDATAQYNLGTAYLYGLGVAKDYRDALAWFSEAAGRGDARAQNNLGVMYLNGWGAPRNPALAAAWFRAAADRGYPYAQMNLGSMYAQGRDVKRDAAKAYLWLDLATKTWNARCEFDECNVLAEYAAQARDIVARSMTADEIGNADKLSASWTKQHSDAGAP